VVAILLLAGCSGRSAAGTSRSPLPTAAPISTARGTQAEPPSETSSAQTNRGQRPDPGRIDGVWEGEYVCNQGATGLRLTVNVISGATTEATFDFYALPENPAVPAGSFAMRGTFSDTLSLDGDRWIDQPTGYVMVGLRADVPPGPISEISGTVVGTNCSTFSVRRPQ
jgi:hypothetical protein